MNGSIASASLQTYRNHWTSQWGPRDQSKGLLPVMAGAFAIAAVTSIGSYYDSSGNTSFGGLRGAGDGLFGRSSPASSSTTSRRQSNSARFQAFEPRSSLASSLSKGDDTERFHGDWDVSIEVPQRYPFPEWRSGETLRGVVRISPSSLTRRTGCFSSSSSSSSSASATVGSEKKIVSVIVRAFWQSSTHYVDHRVVLVPPPPSSSSGLRGKLSLAPSTRQFKAISQVIVDWHRSYFTGVDSGVATTDGNSVGMAAIGASGQEIWHGGELAGISREIERDFPLLTAHNNNNSSSTDEDENDLPPPPEPSTAYDGPPWILPFEFALPTSCRVHVASGLNRAPLMRRLLQTFKRSPPPTFPSYTFNGLRHVPNNKRSLPTSVEYVVEVLVRFADVRPPLPLVAGRNGNNVQSQGPSADEQEDGSDVDPPREGEGDGDEEDWSLPPMFSDESAVSAADLDEYGLMRSNPNLLVKRITFPFEPHDSHTQDLHSHWRPKPDEFWSELLAERQDTTFEEMNDPRPVVSLAVPSFARDPRDEALGGAHMGPSRRMWGILVDEEGGRDKWSSWEKRSEVRNAIGRLSGWIRSEFSCPSPSIISRYAKSIPILVHLCYPTPSDSSSSSSTATAETTVLQSITKTKSKTKETKGKGKTMKTKPVAIEKIVVTLAQKTLSRGGHERPRMGLTEVRRMEIMLWQDQEQRVTTTGSPPPVASAAAVHQQHLSLVPGDINGHNFKLELDLQSPGLNTCGEELIPLSDVDLSFRAPNIEVEYILTATVHPVNKPCFFALRAPVQVISGDFDSTPAYD